MRTLSRIICRCPSKREAEGDLTTRQGSGDKGTQKILKRLALKIRGMQPQAKECPQPPEARRGKGWTLPNLWREHIYLG